jgi:hypothetical protein
MSRTLHASAAIPAASGWLGIAAVSGVVEKRLAETHCLPSMPWLPMVNGPPEGSPHEWRRYDAIGR